MLNSDSYRIAYSVYLFCWSRHYVAESLALIVIHCSVSKLMLFECILIASNNCRVNCFGNWLPVSCFLFSFLEICFVVIFQSLLPARRTEFQPRYLIRILIPNLVVIVAFYLFIKVNVMWCNHWPRIETEQHDAFNIRGQAIHSGL